MLIHPARSRRNLYTLYADTAAVPEEEKAAGPLSRVVALLQ